MVTINITLTGNSGIPLATSDITVTISGPSDTLFTKSYSLSNNEVETIQFSVNEGETVGKWTLLLDSDNQSAEPGDFCFYLNESNKPVFAEVQKVFTENDQLIFQIMEEKESKYHIALASKCAFSEKKIKEIKSGK